MEPVKDRACGGYIKRVLNEIPNIPHVLVFAVRVGAN
jgi:hypothetical protein